MEKLTVGTRILATFALVVGLLALLLLTGYVGFRKIGASAAELSERGLPSYADVETIDHARTDAARAVLGLLTDGIPDEYRGRLYREADEAVQRLDAAWSRFENRRKSDEEAQAFAALRAPFTAWRAAAAALLRAEHERDETPVGTGYRQTANDKVIAAVLAHDPTYKELDPLVRRLEEVSRQRLDEDAAAARSLAGTASIVLALAFLAVVAVALLAGYHLSRSLTAIFGGIAGQLDQLAAGQLPPPITEARGADFNRLRDGLNGVTATLRRLIEDMNRMSDDHERGELGTFVDEERFPGDFRKVAHGLNAMVRSHIQVSLKSIRTFEQFGLGNFDAAVELLPGKKRIINETIERVRANLKALIDEMGRMSAEHERGEIDAVIDEARFPGDFRRMAHGVNAMVGAQLAENRRAMAVFAALGRGDFDATLEPLPGKKRFVNDTVEQVRANLRSLVEDASALARAAVEGRLDVRADASRQPGDFRRIVQGVNETLDALVAPTRDLAGVLGRLAEGDLSARADPERYQHQARALLEGVNRTLAALLAPVAEATEVLGVLARRDLRARMTGEYRGDHAAMKEALNATAQALDEALSQVAESAEQVSSAATQIAASSQAVASGASEGASNLAETAAGVESVSAIAHQASESAQQASGLAQAARAAASEGEAAVEHMQAAMGRIRTSAEGTSQIIRDVSEIAFQTNLLALNAAVEAARAGEAGRGFAVVAEEVRSLALRAKEAASKTEELIRQSVAQTGEGEAASQQVAGKLDEILTGVSRVSDIVQEISVAAREQASGVSQVTTALGEMDKVTQQNAASAEESSGAASELSAQSEELAAMVGAFHLSRAGRARRERAAGAEPAGKRSGANGLRLVTGPSGKAGAPPPAPDDAPLRGF